MELVLVTGAAGFIGSHVAERLLQNDIAVIGIDNINDYYSTAFKERNKEILQSYKHFTFFKGDIADTAFIQSIFLKYPITHVAHIAARAGVRPSIDHPALYVHSNIEGTFVLLQEAVKHTVKNFVLTSSSSVYGNSTAIPFKESDSLTDRPISPYAATKKATEVLGFTYHHLYGLNVNVVRPFTVYGPRGRPDMAPWLFLEATLQGDTITRFGDGSTRRDYTYIDDFVSGFYNALFTPLGYEIFNLGNSQTVSLSEALQTVARICGREQNIIEKPLQPGDVEITFADISKAQKLLNYNPATSFEEGMRKFYEWYKNG